MVSPLQFNQLIIIFLLDLVQRSAVPEVCSFSSPPEVEVREGSWDDVCHLLKWVEVDCNLNFFDKFLHEV